MIKRHLAGGLSACLLVPVFPTVALAASAGIEEVIVTARKREESAQDVPLAIQAFDTEALERYAANDLVEIVELSNQVMALPGASGNGGAFYIRGQGTGTLDPGLESSVVINVDNVQIDRGHIIRQAFFDLENVQILKGPQALFYGKNAPAGVIAVQSARPTEEFEASLQMGREFEAEENFAELVLSGPLTETLGARLAYRWSNMEGFLDNNSQPIANSDGSLVPDEPFDFPGRARDVVGGDESHAVRLTLEWEPTDNFRATWINLVTDYETDNFASIEVANCSGAQPVSTTLGGFAALGTGNPNVGGFDPNGDCSFDGDVSLGSLPPELAATYPFAKDGEPYGKYESALSSLSLDWDIGDYTLSSVTGYYDFDYVRWDNFDGTTLIQFMGVQVENQTTWSQELRLASNFAGPVNFTVGAFYESFERDSDNHGKIFAWGFDPVTGQSNNWSGASTVESESMSAFGQVTWNINEQLELTAGARYTDDDRDAVQGNTYVHGNDAAYAAIGIWCGVPGCDPFFSPAGTVINSEFDDNQFLPEVTLSYTPTDDVTLWAAYKTGYKAGGFSTNTVVTFGRTGDELTFDAEESEGFEVGVKSVLADGRLLLNANAYVYEFTDQQVSAFDNATTSFNINNAASSESYGIEAESQYVLNDRVTLRGQFGWNIAEFDEFPNAQCFAGQTEAEGCVGGVQDIAGDPLVFAPELSGSLGVDLRIPMGSAVAFQASYDAVYTDDYRVGVDPSFVTQDSFWRHNARAGVVAQDGSWDVMFVGRNLTDENWIAGCADKPGGASGDVFCQAIRARQVQLQATYRLQ